MSWLPFSRKTFKVKCKDGTVKTVYRHVNDAFPLHIPGWQANLFAAGKMLETGGADLKAEYATSMHGLLVSLDDFNKGLMMTFRAAYVVYQNDPCEHGSFFEREVTKLLEEQRRLRTLKVQIDGLVQIAKLHPENSKEFSIAMANVVDRMGYMLMPQITLERISEARSLAKKIMEKGNGN